MSVARKNCQWSVARGPLHQIGFLATDNWQRTTDKKSFTLIELIVTIAILGAVMLSFAICFHEAVKTMAPQRAVRSATVLSEDMMHEIRSKNYEDPQTPMGPFGPAEETNRWDFDDVDDYDNWMKSPPETIKGDAMTNYSDFTRSVIIENVRLDDLNAGTPETDGSTDLKRITIVVSSSEIAITNVSVVFKYDR